MNHPEPFALGIADYEDTGPPPAAPPAGRPDLVQKAEIEAAMIAAPADGALRDRYFDLLRRIASVHSGLLTAVLPDFGMPLAFRAGTPDVTALAAIFRDRALGMDLLATPRRILVIGAHAGFSSVDLAHRHPRAHLLCAEPLADNLRLLMLNTAAWRRIRVVPAALWHNATRLAPAGRFQADWAVRLTDEALDAERTIPAISVPEALGRAGWTHADLVLCDACGSEREVFSNPMAAWLQRVDTVIVRAYEQLAPGGLAMVAACFPDEIFSRRSVGLLEVFERRTPLTVLPPAPAVQSLLRAEPGVAPFSVHEVAQYGWAFFVFDGTNCQLHPNPPAAAPAAVIFPITLSGHERLNSGVLHAGQPPAQKILFRATLRRPGGEVLAEGTATLAARESSTLTVVLPPGAAGAAEILLQTSMAEGAAHNQMAWARWIDPRLE